MLHAETQATNIFAIYGHYFNSCYRTLNRNTLFLNLIKIIFVNMNSYFLEAFKKINKYII